MTKIILPRKLTFQQRLLQLVQCQTIWLRAEIVCRLELGLDISGVVPVLLECLDYQDSERIQGEV